MHEPGQMGLCDCEFVYNVNQGKWGSVSVIVSLYA